MHVLEAEERQAIMDMNDVKTTIREIFEVLSETNYIKTISPKPKVQMHGSNSIKHYEYHQGTIRHNIKECATFKVKVQRLLTLRALVIEKPK